MYQQFSDLMESYNDALKESGLGCATRLNKLGRAKVIIDRHEARGLKDLNSSIIAEYSNELSTRLDAGDISKNHANAMRREVEQFLMFVKTGGVRLQNPTLGARVHLSDEFQAIVDGFLKSESAMVGNLGRPLSANTRNNIRWVAHKYFEWLMGQGFKDLRDVGAQEIQKFLLFCSETMTMNSVHNTRLYLTKLYAYLYASKQSISSYGSLLSFKVNRGVRIPEVHSADELSMLLDSIDRSSVEGKRAYAVMLLGIVLGMRAVDVANLSLSDIDWVNGEIKIAQAKTGFPVALPLTKDVGEALKDYILHARPPSDSLQIFLRLQAPHTGIKSAVTIGEIYWACCKAAGLPESKRFHTLRRSRGTSILAAGEPVTMVAEILGHAQVDSTKKYISIDTLHLKMCALSFDGIEPRGRGAI